MNDNENIKQEVLPAGIVTMLFAENKRIIDKQFYIMAGMLFANIGLIALLAYVLKRWFNERTAKKREGMDDRKLAPLILCSASRSEDNATANENLWDEICWRQDELPNRNGAEHLH